MLNIESGGGSPCVGSECIWELYVPVNFAVNQRRLHKLKSTSKKMKRTHTQKISYIFIFFKFFRKHLLNISYVSNSVPGTRDMAINRLLDSHNVLDSWNLYSIWKKQHINKHIQKKIISSITKCGQKQSRMICSNVTGNSFNEMVREGLRC